jgi:hypothetical protein
VYAKKQQDCGVRCLGLVEPDMPGDGSGDLVAHGPAGDLEGELDLTVMVAFVPDQVLEEEDGVVIVDVHCAA